MPYYFSKTTLHKDINLIIRTHVGLPMSRQRFKRLDEIAVKHGFHAKGIPRTLVAQSTKQLIKSQNVVALNRNAWLTNPELVEKLHKVRIGDSTIRVTT